METLAAPVLAGEEASIPLRGHFTVAVYPFIHDLDGDTPAARWEELAARWSPWWTRLADGDVCRALDNSYFFMPFIRDVLYPEARHLEAREAAPGERYERWVPHIRSLSRRLSSLAASVFPEGMLRLTCDHEAVRGASLEIVTGPLDEPSVLRARVEWLDVALFSSGIGLLLFKVVLDDEEPRFGPLLDLNYYLRTVQPPTADWRLAGLRWAGGQPRPLRDSLDFLLEGLTRPLEDGRLASAGALARAEGLSVPRPYSQTAAGQIYSERCQLLSFATLGVDPSPRFSAGDFASAEDRLLFEFASSLGAGDAVSKPEWVPSPEHRRELDQEHRIAIWRCWRGLALRDSLVFLGTEPIGFNETVLPRNIEGDYLPLYLLTLYQKYQLLVFASELVRRNTAVTAAGTRRAGVRHLSEVRRLVDRFVEFRNRFWFNEVTRKPMGGELYRKLQRGLEVPQLYEMVSAEVRNIQEYYEARHQRWAAALMNWVTFVFIPLGAVIGAFSVQNVDRSLFFGVCAAVLAVSGMVWWWWTRE